MNRIILSACALYACTLFSQCKKDNNSSGNNYQRIAYRKDSVNVFASTAFTPNGDGKNDRFGILTLNSGFTDFKLTIYKDNGVTVFETSDPAQSWDGTNGNGVLYTDYHYTFHLHFSIAGDTFDAYSYLYLLPSGNGCVYAHSGDMQRYIFADQLDILSGQAPFPTAEIFCQ